MDSLKTKLIEMIQECDNKTIHDLHGILSSNLEDKIEAIKSMLNEEQLQTLLQKIAICQECENTLDWPPQYCWVCWKEWR